MVSILNMKATRMTNDQILNKPPWLAKFEGENKFEQ